MQSHPSLITLARHWRTTTVLVCLTALLLLALCVGLADAQAADPAPEEGPPQTAKVDVEPIVSLFELVLQSDAKTARRCLTILTEKVQTRELTQAQLDALRPRLEPALRDILSRGNDHPLYLEAALLSASWKDPAGLAAAREVFASSSQQQQRRLQALNALIAAGDDSVAQTIGGVLADAKSNPADFRGAALSALGRLDNPAVAEVVLGIYGDLEEAMRPRAIELLTQRSGWSRALLNAIGEGKVPASALNKNQVARLLASTDSDLVELVTARWGTLRTERNPEREQMIASMRRLVREGTGDPHRGKVAFHKVCGQCHKIYGEGQEVGPDITSNGRASLDQLLSNVFDPNLVIGAAYQSYTLVTADGRVLNGLLVEDSPQRVVLKMQGGKVETIARDDVDLLRASPLSLMPEDVEKQLTETELADLLAFLVLDRLPDDPSARLLPGTRQVQPRQSENPDEFGDIVGWVAPGFSISASGEGGVALLAQHMGRPEVVRTHPISREAPCVLTRSVEVPAEGSTYLLLEVAHHEQGDWRLIVRADGESLYSGMISKETTVDGWAKVRIDLTPLAGKTVKLELLNQANDWFYEFGYWGRVEMVSE